MPNEPSSNKIDECSGDSTKSDYEKLYNELLYKYEMYESSFQKNELLLIQNFGTDYVKVNESL